MIRHNCHERKFPIRELRNPPSSSSYEQMKTSKAKPNSNSTLRNVSMDHRKSIQVMYECVKGLLEEEIADTVGSLNTLECINNDSILKYRDLDIYCGDLTKGTKSVKLLETKLRESVGQLEKAEREVDKLLVLSQQLDQWSLKLLEKIGK